MDEPRAYTDLQDSSWPEIGIPSTLDAYNILCKPLIEVKFKAKL
jgi:hypothetical protein